MQKKSLLKKGLLCGIIVLFLGMSIVPIVGSLPEEKHTSMANFTQSNNKEIKTRMRGLNITFNGTMGQDGWYVSPVEIIIVFESDQFQKYFYYKIDNGDWIEYTPPVDNVFVNEDGGHSFEGYFTDYEGNIEGFIGPFEFRIDQTPPIFINFSATPENAMKTKWLLSAELSDPASGVNHVEFYVDDQLVGTVNATPWEFHYQGKGKMAQAIAYDNAGNSAMSIQIQDLSLILNSQSVQSLNGMLSVQQNLQLK